METLYILRHGKAAKARKGAEDFARPLTAAGRAAARKIGRYLKRERITPSLVFCSPAARARETLAETEAAAGQRYWTEFVPELYMASLETLTEILEASDAETLMLVGHNPGLHELGLSLIAEGPAKDLAALKKKFPAGALLEIDLIKNALCRFVRPKSL